MKDSVVHIHWKPVQLWVFADNETSPMWLGTPEGFLRELCLLLRQPELLDSFTYQIAQPILGLPRQQVNGTGQAHPVEVEGLRQSVTWRPSVMLGMWAAGALDAILSTLLDTSCSATALKTQGKRR